MTRYALDDLMDWGRVLKELEELRKEGLLDAHQEGLRRIIRYKRNWRLRECALECAREVRVPGDELVAEVCSIMCDEDSYAELRTRAAEVLADLVRKRKGDEAFFRGVAIPDKIRQLLAAPLSPRLGRTLENVLHQIEEKENRRSRKKRPAGRGV